MNNPIKIVFMGTPQFAVPFLQALIDDISFEVVAVITQPDKPSGRKQIITPPPVKILAEENNIEVLQPEKLSTQSGQKSDQKILNKLKEIGANMSIVVAYGQIIPKEILDFFKLGNINVHPSLLPKYRGASPIQNAILNGDKKTGMSIMLMDNKMDHGPILNQQVLELDSTETNESLHDKMSGDFGIDLLLATVKQFITGGIKEQEQDHNNATYCKPITKEEAKINWNDDANKISAKIRGFYPWPIAWTTLDNKRIKIFPPVEILEIKKQPGEIFASENQLAVGCGINSLLISSIQLEGKNKINGNDFLRGNSDVINKILF